MTRERPDDSGSATSDPAESRKSGEAGSAVLYIAIDRKSMFAYDELYIKAIKTMAAQFLRNLIATVPDKRHTVFTGNGIPVTNWQQDKYAFTHIVARVCDEHAIAHRLTKTKHPWTKGQVERMNRTLKDATVKRYDDQTHPHPKEHLHASQMAYNFAQRLKTLRGPTPQEYICHCWQKEPARFAINPYHHTLGLNISR
jgi:hypothetical protein